MTARRGQGKVHTHPSTPLDIIYWPTNCTRTHSSRLPPLSLTIPPSLSHLSPSLPLPLPLSHTSPPPSSSLPLPPTSPHPSTPSPPLPLSHLTSHLSPPTHNRNGPALHASRSRHVLRTSRRSPGSRRLGPHPTRYLPHPPPPPLSPPPHLPLRSPRRRLFDTYRATVFPTVLQSVRQRRSCRRRDESTGDRAIGFVQTGKPCHALTSLVIDTYRYFSTCIPYLIHTIHTLNLNQT